MKIKLAAMSVLLGALYFWRPMAVFAAANVPPTPVILSAVQRSGTTFMDIDYRVNDPDDATVQTAALGFVNGGNNLSNILTLKTLMEGTATNLGTNVPANTPLHLTWNVAADWNTNFGNVQVEILAKDGRGLLPFHWITLPSNGPNPEVTINNVPITDSDLLPIWYWLIATGDPAIQLVNGQILAVGGGFGSNVLAQGTSTSWFGRAFLWDRFNIHSLWAGEITRAKAGRYGFQSVNAYSIAKGMADRIYGWGWNAYGQLNIAHVAGITAVALGERHTLILAGGGVTGWGDNNYGQTNVPASATNVVAVAAGESHNIVARSDGSVITWGRASEGQTTIPASATNVVSVAAGAYHSLALKANGTVIGWGAGGPGTAGYGNHGQTTIPASATNVVSVAAGAHHSLALRADGTVVAWGSDWAGENNVPLGLSGIDLLGIGGCSSHVVVVDKRTP
jgi:hypothetical protein